MARPMRFAAPVTSAVFPVRGLFMGGLLLRRIGLERVRVGRRCGLGRRFRAAPGRPGRSGGFALVVLVGGDLLLRAEAFDGICRAGSAMR